MKKKIVAICSCPTGIAQTYMGAEALKEAAKRRNITIKVETRGAFGIENLLTQEDIEEAEYILLASYIEADVIALGAFKGKKTYQVDIHQVVRNVDQVLDDLTVKATII